MRPALALLLVCGLTRLGVTQTRGSIGLGAQTVRFPGGTAFSSGVVSPAAELNTATTVASLTGSLASLPKGVLLSQGRGDWWSEANLFGGLPRVAVEGTLAGTTSSDGSSSAAAYGAGELVWPGSAWGLAVGAGPSAGWISAQPSVVALQLRARGWWSSRTVSLNWSVEPTRFLGAWFTDLNTSVTASSGPFVGTLWASTRVSPVYGSSGAASALVQYFVAPQVSLEFGGGSFLRDPYQGFPQGGYLTLSVRVHSAPHVRPAPAATSSPLILPGAAQTVQFRLQGARTVAIAGDWNEWQLLPLGPLGADRWQGRLSLKPGLYHFDLVVDGDWVVPTGVATVADGFGGLVGLLIVQ